MCQKPDIPKQVTFQDSALLSGLQKINKKLKSLNKALYALRAETYDRSRIQYESPSRSNYRNRNCSRDDSRNSFRDSQVRDRRATRRLNGRNRSRNNSGDRSDGRAKNGRNILNRNPTKIMNIVIRIIILGNTVWRCKPMSKKQNSLRR